MSEDNNNNGMSCNTKSWIIGALFGIAALLIATKQFDTGLIIGLIIGLVVLAGVALLVRKMFCSEIEGEFSSSSTTAAAAVAGGAVASAAAASTKLAASSASASASKAADAVAGAVPAAKAKVTGSTKTAAKAAGGAATSAKKTVKKAVAKKPAAKPAAKAATKAAGKKVTKPAAKAAAKVAKPAAKKPAAKKAAPKTAAKPARTPVAADGKPEMLKKARAGGADDLKQIKGVGPKMEAMLNGMGFYHFDQVSGWRAKEVKWVDDNLEGFKGRVSRDEWVKQAKILAKGGATEFSNKVKKGGVYKN